VVSEETVGVDLRLIKPIKKASVVSVYEIPLNGKRERERDWRKDEVVLFAVIDRCLRADPAARCPRNVGVQQASETASFTAPPKRPAGRHVT